MTAGGNIKTSAIYNCSGTCKLAAGRRSLIFLGPHTSLGPAGNLLDTLEGQSGVGADGRFGDMAGLSTDVLYDTDDF